MKNAISFLLILLGFSFQALSQESQNEHLLDGTSLDYYYPDGGAVHAEFEEGQFKFDWILGPNEGASGECDYKSRKIGDKLYLVNFKYDPSAAFVTIVFNFKQKVFATSAILGAGTDQEVSLFEAGIIKELTLKEK
ncbi:hypothetical protein [Algoriphagus machipongonensis]|uniref:Uncharacterized protein n=1 Tax=Algoriphagus machipongonensis TaxID=388413 RepID=A3HWT3_9BACT|nr:hypothetical protein [Algoriphagus machipongonensis]EAZ81056.1 hypothetical protein ALPR1_18508 [Algoriphagus machipongonensis]